ncbi:MAG TPA: murein L,D-transpeptidase catalytic domain family protein [Aestuariivirga sp.]
MTSSWIVETSQPGVQGFDANTKITAASAKKLGAAGFKFAIRYLTRKSTPGSNDLDLSETEIILKSGLALMAVQHVAKEGWEPSEEKGKTYGQNALAHAIAAGLPAGINIWLDLEGVNHTTSAEVVIAYCNAWFAEVSSGGYVPGIYVGANCNLDGEQLYWRLKTRYYWKSGSSVPAIPERGYCLVQKILKGDIVGGVEIDRNVTREDGFHNLPIWAVAEASPAAISSARARTEALAPSDAVILRELAQTDDLGIAVGKLLDYRNTHIPGSRPRYWAVVNFTLHSKLPRLFVFDIVDKTVSRFLCAHGRGSEGASDDGFANVFSNVDGSNASSLGVYMCAETYYGDHGYSMRLDGKESTNSHARHRAIVVHGADYVSPEIIDSTGRIGRSLGCPAVENRHATEIIDALKEGSLMIIWKSDFQII